MICTPELSAKVIKAVEESNFTYNNGTQVVCLGKVSGCSNLFELVKDVNENDATEPVKITDADKEKLIIYWSSGTTGN